MNDPEAESKNAASPPPLKNRPAETERGCLVVVATLATVAMIPFLIGELGDFFGFLKGVGELIWLMLNLIEIIIYDYLN